MTDAPISQFRFGGGLAVLRNSVRSIAMVFCLAVSACGTPQEVKTLSKSQLQAFDTAIEISKIHAEAIVSLAKNYRDAKLQLLEQQIEGYKKSSIDALVQEDDTEAAIGQAFASGKSRAESFLGSKYKLANDIKEIENKVQELQRLLAEMKRAQMAIDQYLETEAVGQSLFEDVGNSPIVRDVMGRAGPMISEVTATSEELEAIVEGIDVGGGEEDSGA